MEYIANMSALDWVGVFGSLVIAGAYYAVSAGYVDAHRPPFHLMNLTGAGLILLSLYVRPNPGAITIEILWILVAVSGLLRYMFKRK